MPDAPEISGLVKDFLTPVLVDRRFDEDHIIVGEIWRLFIEDLSKYTRKPKFVRLSRNTNDYIQDNVLDKWSKNRTEAHLDIVLAAYHYAHRSSNEAFARAANEIDKAFLGQPFEEMFGAPVPMTDEAASEIENAYQARKSNELQSNASISNTNEEHVVFGTSYQDKFRKAVFETTISSGVNGKSSIDTIAIPGKLNLEISLKPLFAFAAPALVLMALIVFFTVKHFATTSTGSAKNAPQSPNPNDFEQAISHAKAGAIDAQRASLLAASEEGHPTSGLEAKFLDFAAADFKKSPEFTADFEKIIEKSDVFARADSDDYNAVYLKGLMFMHGLQVDKDLDQARHMLSVAMANGISRAAVPLSVLILDNDAIKGKCQGHQHAVQAKLNGYLAARLVEARYLIEYACPRMSGSRPQAHLRAYTLVSEEALVGNANAQNLLGEMYKEQIGVPESSESDFEAVRWFKAAADQGHITAKNNLGVMYSYSRGVTKSDENDQIAVRLFRETASQQNASGQHSLGWMYMKGRASPSDGAIPDFEAARLFRLASDQSYLRAKVDLAWMYRQGRGVAQNDREAVRLYREAAEAGHVDAQLRLAYMYRLNKGVEKDENNLKKAYDIYRELASKNAEAQYQLGRLYFLNLGVPSHHDINAEALKWFKKAAEKENLDAINGLGVLYEFGRGVEKDLHAALRYYVLAADMGNSQAKVNLGNFYQQGKVLNTDLAISINLFEEANDEGNLDATAALGWAYSRGLGVEKDDAKAQKLLQEAAAKGSAKAQNDMGIIYEEGLGVPQNYKEAAVWYKKAANNGHSHSTTKLGWFYESGFGVRQDYSQAKKSYEKAAKQDYPWAMYNLAWVHKQGNGTPQNYLQAFKLFQMSAELGYASAQFQLGRIYSYDFETYGVEYDLQKAIDFLEIAAENGENNARQELATIYFNKGSGGALGIEKSNAQLNALIDERATPYFRDLLSSRSDIFFLVRSDNEASQICEVYRFCYGFGGDELISKFEEIAELGVPAARGALAVYFYEEDSNEKYSHQLAVLDQEFESGSIEAGVIAAYVRLHVNEEDCGRSFNLAQITNPLIASASEGNRYDIWLLGTLKENKTCVWQTYYDDWLETLEQKADTSELTIQYETLGDIYALGMGGKMPDTTNAEKWYRRALAHGQTKAALSIAYIFINNSSEPRLTDAKEMIETYFGPLKLEDVFSKFMACADRYSDDNNLQLFYSYTTLSNEILRGINSDQAC